MASLVLLAAMALQSAAGDLQKELPPRPASNPADWVLTDDYPMDAAREGRSGRTSVELLVGRDGVPRTCRVAGSSGHTDLDQAACAAMMARARFIPAADAQGRNRSSTFRRRVSWNLPEENEDPMPSLDELVPPGLRSMTGYVVSYTVHPDGRVTNCVTQRMGPQNDAEAPPLDCATLTGTPQPPAIGTDGQPVVRRMTYMHIAADFDQSSVPTLPPADD
jgi:TonB family protein